LLNSRDRQGRYYADGGILPLSERAAAVVDLMWTLTMSIGRLRTSLLALVALMACGSLAWGDDPRVANYPIVRRPASKQASGPPQPARDRPGQVPAVSAEPPRGIDAPGPEFASIEDVEVWAPADISAYTMGSQANTGWWLSLDCLRYTASPPHRQTIGNPSVSANNATGALSLFGTTSTNSNSQFLTNSTAGSTANPEANPQGAGGCYGIPLRPADTGSLGDGPSNGYRWEGGWMDKDEGFLVSGTMTEFSGSR